MRRALTTEWTSLLQEEKERKEQEEQRKKQDEDAKKKKVLTNMTHQYGSIQQKVSFALTLRELSSAKEPVYVHIQLTLGSCHWLRSLCM